MFCKFHVCDCCTVQPSILHIATSTIVCSVPAALVFPVEGQSIMHYMTGPDRETPEQLQHRLRTSTQGLPPIAETRNWAISFSEYQLQTWSVEPQLHQDILLEFTTKLQLLQSDQFIPDFEVNGKCVWKMPWASHGQKSRDFEGKVQHRRH